MLSQGRSLSSLSSVCHPLLPRPQTSSSSPRPGWRQHLGLTSGVLTGSLLKPALQEVLQGSSHRLSCRESNHNVHTEFSGLKKKKEEEDHRLTVGSHLQILSPLALNLGSSRGSASTGLPESLLCSAPPVQGESVFLFSLPAKLDLTNRQLPHPLLTHAPELQ